MAEPLACLFTGEAGFERMRRVKRRHPAHDQVPQLDDPLRRNQDRADDGHPAPSHQRLDHEIDVARSDPSAWGQARSRQPSDARFVDHRSEKGVRILRLA